MFILQHPLNTHDSSAWRHDLASHFVFWIKDEVINHEPWHVNI